MKTVLITGIAGYIGSVSANLFLDKGYRIVGIDNFQTGNRDALAILEKIFGKDRLTFYEIDIHQKLDKVFNENRIDSVIHYAASCLVTESMENPHKYFYNNVAGSLNLLETISRYKIPYLVFSSTCAVYGESQYVPIDENHPRIPNNPYGESKYMVEQMIDWYAKLKGLKYVILRYFNVCGATDDGIIGDSKKPSVLLVQNAVKGALGIEPFYLTCPKVDTPDKTPIRDYINVVDLNEAHALALAYLEKGNESNIFNLGTGKGSSVLEIVKTVEAETGVKIDINEPKDIRKGEPARLIANPERANRLLKWKPERSLKQSVNSLIKWYKNHPHGWDN